MNSNYFSYDLSDLNSSLVHFHHPFVTNGPMQPHQTAAAVAYARLLAESFAHWTGAEILPGASRLEDTALAEALWQAPFGLVSHGRQADPVFRYGNKLALELFEMTWDEFTKLPSRMSAETATGIQDDRNRLMAEALKKGWVTDYRGIRISKSGQRFEIKDTILWNVVDAQGARHGQAALIKGWQNLTLLDGGNKR